jgi:hypothetical protein
MAEEMVTITKKEYDSLLKDAAWLSALEDAGVDNWDGVSFAWELFEEENFING